MSALIFIFIPKKKVLLKFEGFLQLNRMTINFNLEVWLRFFSTAHIYKSKL